MCINRVMSNKTKRSPGHPRRFPTPEILQVLVDAYFACCDTREVDGKLKPEPYTVLGLCGSLDITRQTLFDYGKMDGYSDIVKKAKEKIAQNLTLRSIDDRSQTVGCIFQLKCNHGHVERQIVDNVSSDGSMSPPARELTEEEVEAELKRRGIPLPKFDGDK